jgi:hypothetical protein
VHVVDTTPPSLPQPPDVTAPPTTDPAGTAVSWDTITATDTVDGSVDAVCSPSSGSTFPVGTSTVTCSATDSHGNSAQKQFTVSVAFTDTQAPTFTSVPGPINVEASEPVPVTYSVSAIDNSGNPPTINCSPSSGSNFPIGTTSVNCTATDGSGNSSSASFTVTVVFVDNVGPVLSGVPSSQVVEANGPGGSAVNYPTPTATDNVDGPIAVVTCSPASGSTFSLGTTTVTCGASDSRGNTGTASFSVTVVDTTKPVLTPPGDRNVYATTETGIPRDDPAVTPFLSGATATDIVDSTLTIANNAPSFLPIGTTVVTFTTGDDSGNTAQGSAVLTVFPTPPAGTTPAPLPQPPGRTPPEDVKNLKAKAGSHQVTLSWTKPTSADFDHVTITRTLSDGSAATVVYTGSAASYIDRTVQNGLEYRYTVVSFDKGGNRSAGAVVVAVPKQPLLLTPRDGVRVKSTKKTLKLSWVRMAGADYYNVQLYLVPDLKALGLQPTSAQAEVKVLTVWPKKNSFVLKKTWKFAGVRYRLRPGLYRWYVWPGFGARAAVDYGPLMGSSTFQVVR